MRRLITLFLLSIMVWSTAPRQSFAALSCVYTDITQEASSVGSQGGQCRANVCASLNEQRNTYYDRLRNYSVALDEPFEELFLRLKGSLGNYRQDLLAVCGSAAQPLPVCGGGDQVTFYTSADSATIRNECGAEVDALMDTADTVIRELLLQLAGNQRTHAYARRVDALAQEWKKLNQKIAQVVTYIKKIKLTGLVGDGQ